ncbi:MAG: DUF4268 domain-containing protein [Bacilli bacterium]|nr:DUF4268 domain-containing protein [Bacilli bacterium]
MEIGKLDEVELRNLWKHEQYDFSEWLSETENIEILNDVLGLTLTDISKEVYAGTYRCDLVGVDESTGIKIIVENQLEASNHDHLGKIITYASGLDAQVVVWIVKQAKEEHKSAIEWLNNNTNSNINFFLIELHAYKIGNSLPAPYFEVVEKPNDFIKNSKTNSNQGQLTKSQSERLEFWSKFNEILIDKGKPFNVRKATADHWYDVAIGSSSSHIAIELINKEGYIRIGLYMINDKAFFDKLYENKEKIEGDLGIELEWLRECSGNVSRIKYNLRGLNYDDHSNYDELINRTIEIANKMQKIFKSLLNTN